MSCVTIRQGFTSKYFLDLYISVVILGVLSIFLSYIISIIYRTNIACSSEDCTLVNIGALLGFAAMSYSIVAALMIVIFITGVAAVAALNSIDVSISKIALPVVISIVLSAYIAGVISGFSASAGTISVYLSGIYYSYCSLNGNPKFEILHKFALIFSTIGGTKFRNANLTNSNFTEASLTSSDFRNSQDNITNLTRTIWKQARNLNRSRLGTSILSNSEVRELLVTGKPNQSKSYEGLNLRGANLDGVYLEKVNFKRAILSEASFRNANLEWVNFTETQAISTDFTGAQMTGVCLEGWSYDHTTKLDDVDCRFVFELEHPNAKGSRERRPHDPEKEFAAGDFTKRYSETINIVQLLIRNGINREAFIAAWEKLTEEYPDINPDDIQEIKKKGQDVELTVAVPQDTDKGKFEHNFDIGYETKLKEIEAKYQAQLESKEAMILLQKQNIADIKEILQIAKSPNVNIQNEAKAVAEQNPVTIKAGRDISGNVINLGEIKGNVTNAINQIPNKEDSGDIKTLLTQLQEAISSDKELADEDKADALEQVENLAKIALHDKPEEKSTLASKAIRALKRIIDNIPTIAKIVETVSKVFGA